MSSNAVLTLASLATASAVRYDGAVSHVIRTALVAECLAALAGLGSHEQEKIRLATPVHDVGKLAVPDSVLLKPGRLDVQERVEIERHSSIGADILSGSTDELLQFAALMARCHHERYDGMGYPQGLAGDELPLAVRVVSIADAFDAMTEDRCYRPGMTEEAACAVLEHGIGTHFDGDLVSIFIDGFSRIQSARRSADQALRCGPPAEVVSRFYGLQRQ
ncbi:HD-GYP domain-containing protein [Cupriavidus pauculus]|uniref:Phosphohydrolase n=1 Tax=Cupriavidus pauculus TaxID=82633 RepID=A0A2N5CDM7_9BURK|nr:HD domain-containing phosphohydrolase [Cupriavidus pauculus]PLQ00316.1 phosphohydrolase [Cupriavidus pauculus]